MSVLVYENFFSQLRPIVRCFKVLEDRQRSLQKYTVIQITILNNSATWVLGDILADNDSGVKWRGEIIEVVTAGLVFIVDLEQGAAHVGTFDDIIVTDDVQNITHADDDPIEDVRPMWYEDRFSLPYMRELITTAFQAQDSVKLISNQLSAFETHLASIDSLKETLITMAENLILAWGSALGSASTIVEDILEDLAIAIDDDATHIQYRSVGIAALDRGSSVDSHVDDAAQEGYLEEHTNNIGDGRCLFTFTRPGIMTPEEGSHVEVMNVECVRGVPEGETAGAEVFRITGEPGQARTSYLKQGSGANAEFMNAGGSGFLTDPDFETWAGALSTDGLTNWTLDTGDWGTELEQDTAEELRGTHCIKINSAGGVFELSQVIGDHLAPNSVYAFGLWLKDPNATTVGTLRIRVEDGAGVQVLATYTRTITLATVPAGWTFYWFVFVTGGQVEDTWVLNIELTAVTDADVYMDASGLTKMTAANGIYFATFSGATDFFIGDKFGYGADVIGFEVELVDEGYIQAFLTRCFKRQLPSNATPDIADPT